MMPMYTDDVVRSKLTMRVDRMLDAYEEDTVEKKHNYRSRARYRDKIRAMAHRLRKEFDLSKEQLCYWGRGRTEAWTGVDMGDSFIGAIGGEEAPYGWAIVEGHRAFTEAGFYAEPWNEWLLCFYDDGIGQ